MSFFKRLLSALDELLNSPASATTPNAPPGAGKALFLSDRSRWQSTIRGIKERRDLAGLDTLLQALSQPDAQVREEAMIALYSLGRDAKSALPAVLRGLQDPNERVRQWAASVLAPGSLAPPAEEVFPALIACFLGDPCEHVRREVISILAAHLSSRTEALLPTVIPVFLAGLRDPCVEVRRQAAYSAGSNHSYFRKDERARKALATGLLQAITDKDAGVQRRSVVALSHIDSAAADGLPVLRGMLLNPEQPHVVNDAAEALKRIHGSEPKALLFELLRSPEPAHRARAAFALLPSDLPPEAFQEIVSIFHGDHGKVTAEFLTLLHLRSLESWQKEALIPPLLGLLSGAPETAKKSVRLLAFLGENHPTVIQAVIGQIQSKDEEMRREAAEALGRVCKDAEIAVPVLRGLLRERSEGVLRDASRALGWLGSAAAPAVPDMLAILRSYEDTYTRTTLLYALGSIGPAASEAIPTMLDLLRSPEPSTREGAADALARVKASSALLQKDIPELILRGLQTDTYSMKSSLLRAVATCGEGGAPFAEAVGMFLGGDEKNLADQAISALEAFGTEAIRAVPAMVAALPGNESYKQDRLLRVLVKAKEGLRDGDEQVLRGLVRGATAQRVRSLLPQLIALGSRGTLALLEATQHQDEALCKTASDELRKLGNAAIPALGRALFHEEASLRLRAVGALSDLGEAAFPALREALQHEDELLRTQVEIALGV